MKTFLRSLLLAGLVVGAAAVYFVSRRMVPGIQCSGEPEEGQSFYCTATLDYPPAEPRFSWAVDGECAPDRLTGQTIRLSTPIRTQGHSCVIHLAVYERTQGDGLLATMRTERPIRKTTASILSGTAPLAGTATVPQKPPRFPGYPVLETAAGKIQLTSLPDRSQQGIDGAAVQGNASGKDLAHYKVAVYALIENRWQLQGASMINLETGKWDVVSGFGNSYAALLVKDSFETRATMRAIPPVGGEIIDLAVKKSN